MEYSAEEIRDGSGKLTGIRIRTVDANGRPVFTDVPTSAAVGISMNDLVAAVATQAKAAVSSGTAAHGSPALSTAQVQAVAKQVAAKKR